MAKLWKPLAALALVCVLLLAGVILWARPDASATKRPEDQFRAVWVSTVYRLDYPSQASTDPAVLKADADEILSTCAELGMTAVILQVRPCADPSTPRITSPGAPISPADRERRRQMALTPWPTGWSRPTHWDWSSTPGSTPSG